MFCASRAVINYRQLYVPEGSFFHGDRKRLFFFGTWAPSAVSDFSCLLLKWFCSHSVSFGRNWHLETGENSAAKRTGMTWPIQHILHMRTSLVTTVPQTGRVLFGSAVLPPMQRWQVCVMKMDKNVNKTLIYIVIVSYTSQIFKWCPCVKCFAMLKIYIRFLIQRHIADVSITPVIIRAGLNGWEARGNFHWRASMTYFMTSSFVKFMFSLIATFSFAFSSSWLCACRIYSIVSRTIWC